MFVIVVFLFCYSYIFMDVYFGCVWIILYDGVFDFNCLGGFVYDYVGIYICD